MAAATLVGQGTLVPLRSILMAFPIALFTGAVVTDIAYLNTAQMQWSNFSAWMIAGGVAFGGVVSVWALVDALRARPEGRVGGLVGFALVAVMTLLGLINAIHHSRDAWSSVGVLGLTLSIVTAALALVFGWMLYARPVVREDVS